LSFLICCTKSFRRLTPYWCHGLQAQISLQFAPILLFKRHDTAIFASDLLPQSFKFLTHILGWTMIWVWYKLVSWAEFSQRMWLTSSQSQSMLGSPVKRAIQSLQSLRDVSLVAPGIPILPTASIVHCLGRRPCSVSLWHTAWSVQVSQNQVSRCAVLTGRCLRERRNSLSVSKRDAFGVGCVCLG
jgi:hypothetical protein